MGWWSKAVSAVKSAVNKAVSAVKSVASSVSKSVSKAVSSASSAVSKVASSVSSSVSKAVSSASSAVSKVATTVKNTVAKVVEDVSDKVEDIKDAIKDKVSELVDSGKLKIEDAEDTIKRIIDEAVEKTKDKVKDVDDIIKKRLEEAVEKTKDKIEAAKRTAERLARLLWQGMLSDAFKSAATVKLPFLKIPRFDIIESVYTLATGKRLTEAESIKLRAKVFDYIVPLNSLSKLFLGKNLDGELEEFGSVEDYADIVLALAIIVPVGKIGAVAGKLGIKAGTRLGLSGFTKLGLTKIDDAAKLFKILNVDDQTKLIRSLLKTDDGVVVINKLLSKKALQTTLVKPTISLVNKKITEKILLGSGFGALIKKAFRPKTIIFGLAGMSGLLGLAYGIPFGTSWLAKEGIKEQFEIPLADRMRDYRFEPTVEKLEIIRDDIKKLRQALPIARTTIMKVAWLWPPTKEAWEFYAENIYFSIEQYERELELLLPPELMVLPETVISIVRDIIDGDTIDVDLTAKNQETGAEIKLPEYQKTGHGRIRLVGINAPEKSPKGEILCSDVEIFNVEKEFADESRDRLVPLNDKEVILKIDPEIPVDTYGRILAVVEYGGVDIGLRQIKEGLACGYYREPHKYYDEGEYSAATLAAKDEGIGMWAGLEEIEKEEDKIKIIITSEPTNARLFLDDVALRHNTPSDEVELSDMLHLFTLGPHVLSAEKGGLSAMEDIEIVKGDNGTIHLTLVTAPFPEVPTEEEIKEEELKEELIEEEVEEEEIVEPVPGAVKMAEIPKEYTDEQAWALKEAFAKILILTEGTAIMSEKERDLLINEFALYTDGQKEVLNLLWRDITFYTQGTAQLSANEFILLKEKYRVI